MKNFLSVALIFFTVILIGCGNNVSKYSDETFLKENSSWVEDKRNIADFLNAAGLDEERKPDEDFFMQQIIEGKINFTDKEIKVAVIGELNNGKIVEVKILQGRYKNKTVYTIPEFIKDLKEEIERKKENEKKISEKEQARMEQIAEVEKQRLKSLIQDGVKFEVAIKTSNGYRNFNGTTNLPDGTILRVSVARESLETVVRNGSFSALFEQIKIPIGEQYFSITTLSKELQPLNVQLVNNTMVKDKSIIILGKEIYSGKITVW